MIIKESWETLVLIRLPFFYSVSIEAEEITVIVHHYPSRAVIYCSFGCPFLSWQGGIENECFKEMQDMYEAYKEQQIEKDAVPG